MKGNGKITARHIRGGNPRITIRIEDPDGVADFWIYIMNNNGQWQPLATGTGNCDTDILLNVAINPQNVGMAHKVVYKDCQATPAYEVWELKKQFTEWTEGERTGTGYEAEEYEPQEEFPERIEPESWWTEWYYWAIGGLVMLGLAGFFYLRYRRSED